MGCGRGSRKHPRQKEELRERAWKRQGLGTEVGADIANPRGADGQSEGERERLWEKAHLLSASGRTSLHLLTMRFYEGSRPSCSIIPRDKSPSPNLIQPLIPTLQGFHSPLPHPNSFSTPHSPQFPSFGTSWQASQAAL